MMIPLICLICPPPDNVKFLPETIEGLGKRFNKLFCEFWREKQYKQRNELVFLLDEMLRQGDITRDIYKRVNSLLAQSIIVRRPHGLT